MNSLQLFLIAAGISLISWTSAEGSVPREYLPPTVPVAKRTLLHYPSYYKPQYYNQYQQEYYPSYTSSYYTPQYSTGLTTGSGLQALGQQITTGTSLGLTGLGGFGYYPSLNLDLITGVKPRVNVVDTVYDTNGGYVYGKKK